MYSGHEKYYWYSLTGCPFRILIKVILLPVSSSPRLFSRIPVSGFRWEADQIRSNPLPPPPPTHTSTDTQTHTSWAHHITHTSQHTSGTVIICAFSPRSASVVALRCLLHGDIRKAPHSFELGSFCGPTDIWQFAPFGNECRECFFICLCNVFGASALR